VIFVGSEAVVFIARYFVVVAHAGYASTVNVDMYQVLCVVLLIQCVQFVMSGYVNGRPLRIKCSSGKWPFKARYCVNVRGLDYWPYSFRPPGTELSAKYRLPDYELWDSWL
jgi:hypothetical protein